MFLFSEPIRNVLPTADSVIKRMSQHEIPCPQFSRETVVILYLYY